MEMELLQHANLLTPQLEELMVSASTTCGDLADCTQSPAFCTKDLPLPSSARNPSIQTTRSRADPQVIKGFLQAAVKEAHLRDEFRASPSCLVGVLWAASQCGVPCDTLTQVAKGVLLPPDAGRTPDGNGRGVVEDRSVDWCKRKQGRSQRIIKRLEVAGDHVLLPLRIGEEVALSGTLHLRVLRGAAEEFRRIVVPPWSPTPRLLALRGADEDVATSEPAEIRSFLEARKWPVVLCLRAPRAVDAASTAAPRITELQRLREALASPEARHRLRAHRAWPKIVQHFVEQCIRGSSHENPAVLLVMGAKGVGKSTCCRFLVNRLLLQVYFLETDLGQPELGPPGVVTLHRIKDPLLQVPHAEQQLHERCEAFFAGAATPQSHPALYTASAMAIQDFFSDVPRWHLPLTRFRFGLFAGHLLPSEVEAALTGAVVALCYDAWEPNSRAVAKAPAELEIFEPHEAPIKFLAYAFIHSFNFKTGELVVYANISAAKLKQVNLLLRGEVIPEKRLVPAAELLRFLATAGLLASGLARAISEKVLEALTEAEHGKTKVPAWVMARCIAGLAIAVQVEPVISALKALSRAAAPRAVELLPEECWGRWPDPGREAKAK
eukprot:g25533.t1